jgi:hypothetical protein
MTVATAAVIGGGLLAGAGSAATDNDWHATGGVTTAANHWYGAGVTPTDVDWHSLGSEWS